MSRWITDQPINTDALLAETLDDSCGALAIFAKIPALIIAAIAAVATGKQGSGDRPRAVAAAAAGVPTTSRG